MTLRLRSLVFAASLVAIPLAGALAQSSPSAAKDNRAQPSMSNEQSGSTETGPATSKHTEGATGRTIVPGDESTVAGNRKATSQQKTQAR